MTLPLKDQDFAVHLIDVHGGHDTFQISKALTRLYYILERTGVFTIDNQKYDLVPGLLVEVPPGVEYSYSGSMKIFLVSHPRWFEGNERTTRKEPRRVSERGVVGLIGKSVEALSPRETIREATTHRGACWGFVVIEKKIRRDEKLSVEVPRVLGQRGRCTANPSITLRWSVVKLSGFLARTCLDADGKTFGLARRSRSSILTSSIFMTVSSLQGVVLTP